MNITFFTEGGRKIGLGHVSRCAALAEGFRCIPGKAQICFALRGDKTALDFLGLHGFSGEFFDWEKDLERTERLLSGAEVAVVDSYLAREDFYHLVAERARRLLVFDDFFRLSYPEKAFIINPAAEPDGHPRHLFGLEYVVLRPAFWNVPRRLFSSKIKIFLVMMGAMDTSNFLEKLVNFLHKRYPSRQIILIVAKSLSFSFPKIKIFVKVSAIKLLELIYKADIAISAGGQTLYELIRSYTPTIAIITANNQNNNVAILSNKHLIWNAGWYNNDVVWKKIEQGIDYWSSIDQRERFAKIVPKFIDGQGVIRIIKKIWNA